MVDVMIWSFDTSSSTTSSAFLTAFDGMALIRMTMVVTCVCYYGSHKTVNNVHNHQLRQQRLKRFIRYIQYADKYQLVWYLTTVLLPAHCGHQMWPPDHLYCGKRSYAS